jgi:hypothetical protein
MPRYLLFSRSASKENELRHTSLPIVQIMIKRKKQKQSQRTIISETKLQGCRRVKTVVKDQLVKIIHVVYFKSNCQDGRIR